MKTSYLVFLSPTLNNKAMNNKTINNKVLNNNIINNNNLAEDLAKSYT